MRAETRRLVVALHDVAPPFEGEIRAQIRALEALGVRPLVMKVVPNWNGTFPMDDFPGFVELLRERQGLGDQIVLHGWEHRVNGGVRGSAAQRIRAKLFARQSEEFLALTRDESRDAVRSGLEMFERCSLEHPTTFSPPAWLISSEAERGVADARIRRLIKMFTLEDLEKGRAVRVPAFGYMGAGPKQELGVSLMNGPVVRLWVPRSDMVKVFLHPAGAVETAACRRTLSVVRNLLQRGWHPSTFDQVMGLG